MSEHLAAHQTSVDSILLDKSLTERHQELEDTVAAKIKQIETRMKR